MACLRSSNLHLRKKKKSEKTVITFFYFPLSLIFFMGPALFFLLPPSPVIIYSTNCICCGAKEEEEEEPSTTGLVQYENWIMYKFDFDIKNFKCTRLSAMFLVFISKECSVLTVLKLLTVFKLSVDYDGNYVAWLRPWEPFFFTIWGHILHFFHSDSAETRKPFLYLPFLTVCCYCQSFWTESISIPCEFLCYLNAQAHENPLCLEVWFSSDACWRETFGIYWGSNLFVGLSEQTSEVLTARSKD